MATAQAEFDGLVGEFVDAPDDDARAAATARLWDRFGCERALWVSDLSGFTRLAGRYDIVHFLGLIRECRRTIEPIIAAHDGVPIKATADNVYASFASVEGALTAAVEARIALDELNADRPPDHRVELCVGIGFGRILLIDDHDFFGQELNLAFKLGEDIANAGEILVTQAAIDRVAGGDFRFDPRTASTSNVAIPHGALVTAITAAD